MDKSEINTLELFLTCKTPYDFECGVYNTILIDSLMGLVHQTLKGKKMKKSYVSQYEISDENMPLLLELSNRSMENKDYYKLIMDCFKIVKEYAI